MAASSGRNTPGGLDEFVRRRLFPILDAAEAHGLSNAEVRATLRDSLSRSRPLTLGELVEALARRIERKRRAGSREEDR